MTDKECIAILRSIILVRNGYAVHPGGVVAVHIDALDEWAATAKAAIAMLRKRASGGDSK